MRMAQERQPLISNRINPAGFTLLDETSGLLLRAISGSGPDAVAAFRDWRLKSVLDEVALQSHRILPLLADLIQREGLDDPDLNRMRGVGRHIWVENMLKLRLLDAALEALSAEGIHPVLLKGGALFARSPATIGKRASADYDILIRPNELQRVGLALRKYGFSMPGHHWDDLGPPLVESVAAGVAVTLDGRIGELDVHWRPLWNIRDPGLAERFFSRAERRELQSRLVLIPTLAHQLFAALARCEPWDKDECFVRLVEGQLLLSGHAAEADWTELVSLIQQYGLEAPALAFLGDLIRSGAVDVPGDLMAVLDAGISPEKQKEWATRAIAPERRSNLQRWRLERQDAAFHRDDRHFALPTLREIRLRRLGLGRVTAGTLWQAARDRLVHGPVEDLQFLEGFSYPENDGRWSMGRWSVIALPLSVAQQAGEPVRLNAYPFPGKIGRARIVAIGGCETLDRVIRGDVFNPNLAIAVRPLPELGGGGLILLWLPDAMTPRSVNGAADNRELGLFIRREWQLPARKGDRLYARLRKIHCHLTLPLALRQRIAALMRRS